MTWLRSLRVINVEEIEACVSSPAPSGSAEWNPYFAPERIDGVFAGTDTDGDTLVDEGLPPGTESVDCDGDGFTGAAERYVFSRTTTVDDQAACAETSALSDEANDRWPADFNDSRSVNASDVLALKLVFGTLVPPTLPRYDIAPTGSITVSDVPAIKPVFGRVCTTPQPGG